MGRPFHAIGERGTVIVGQGGIDAFLIVDDTLTMCGLTIPEAGALMGGEEAGVTWRKAC
jgi:hypothetical protein